MALSLRQDTAISTIFNEWLTVNGAMPQGSWLGPLCFVALINDLHSTCLTHKLVDVTTLSEILLSKHLPNTLTYLNSNNKWTETNLIKIN